MISYFILFVKLHIVPAKLLRGDSQIENSVRNVDPTFFFGGGEGVGGRWGGRGVSGYIVATFRFHA